MPELLPSPGPLVTAEMPQPGVSPAEIAQPYRELADTLDKGSQATEAFAESSAKRAGLGAIGFDQQGNLTVQPMPIIGPASDVYANAAKYSAVAQGDGMVRRAVIGLRAKTEGDPEGFSTAAQAYKQELVSQYGNNPEVGLALGKMVDEQTTFVYRSMLWQQEARITRNFDETTRALVQSKTSDLLDLISANGINDPTVKTRLAEIHSILQQRTKAPLSESPDLVNLQIDQLDRDIRAAAFGNRVNRALKNPGAPYQGMIQTSAAKYGLDPTLLTRQLAQESGFHERAVSGAGAAGIAQFMPETARRYGVDVFNPQSSIEGQAHYMSDLSKQFGGNMGLALAGYNWGEKNVAAWIASGANPASMPAETRNYVRSITGIPIEAWTRGERPNAMALGAAPLPGANQGGVASALQMVQAHADDQSVDPTQRRLDTERGLSLIKDYRNGIVRDANVAVAQQKATDNQFETAVIADSANPQPSITENDIKTMAGVSPEAKMRMLAFRKQQGMPEPMARISNAESVDIFRRMNLPEGDPGKLTSMDDITQAYIDGKLTRTDFNWLQGQFQNAHSPAGERLSQIRGQFSKAVEPAIDKSNPLMGSIDWSGKLQNYAFERFVDTKITEYQKAGKSPFDLFDPSKPDYLGTPKVLSQFQKPFQQSVQDLADRLAPPAGPTAPLVPQRKPGETFGDWLKRSGAM